MKGIFITDSKSAKDWNVFSVSRARTLFAPFTVPAVLIASWYAMMAIHEAGHCLGAVATDAVINEVEIPLAGFSRTDFSGGSCPLAAVWAGPVFGAVAPLLSLPFLHRRGRLRDTLMFFAGFSLLANGAYIGLGAFAKTGDCLELLKYGAPPWSLVVFGSIASIGGLCVWHRLGPPSGWFKAQ